MLLWLGELDVVGLLLLVKLIQLLVLLLLVLLVMSLLQSHLISKWVSRRLEYIILQFFLVVSLHERVARVPFELRD